ncbi:MAG: alpha-hydroxy-acid oxidizing protein, partial [Candidatus Altiarchaeales archaeon]|nr:alpha-hydroxy-acid oxidizing protein [Candidatus Altiarchaeales archaeon]
MIDKRKEDHLRICVEEEIESGSAGFEDVRLTHRALPELDFDDINLETEFLGKTLTYPVIMEGITGGVPRAEKINRDLATLAEEFGIGFGVGSQRMAIEDLKL